MYTSAYQDEWDAITLKDATKDFYISNSRCFIIFQAKDIHCMYGIAILLSSVLILLTV